MTLLLGSNIKRHDYPGTVDDMQPAFSPPAPIWIADEPPTGAKQSGSPYEGYEGNEAVVSPVTGILMEYGTYDAESAQENRENIDLKYGGLLEGYEYETEEVTVTDPETGETTTTTEILYPSDKVGYAVIKVLDAETYKKLESTVENKWKSESLVQINEKSVNYDAKEYAAVNKHVTFKEKTDELTDEDRDWTKLDETVYGYKEFVEQYEQFGIGGYYIYIDGFKCETVDKEAEETEESDGGTETDETDDTSSKKFIPAGDPLTIDSFKISDSDVLNEDFEPETESLYEPDEVSKLVSEEFTKKLKAESAIKSDASIGITFKYVDKEVDEDGNVSNKTNEYILIKEGTVLGRTLTDFELLEGPDFRNKQYGTYDEYVEAQKGDSSDEEQPEIISTITTEENPNADLIINRVPLVGNYLRIIMQETNGDIVENVEDYMKIDEGDTMGAVSQEYKAWPGDLEVLAEVMHHEAGYDGIASHSKDQTEADFEEYCMGYSVVNKVLEQNKSTHYGNLYDDTRTDMSPLVQVTTNQKYGWYASGVAAEALKVHNGEAGCYTEKELEYAEYCLQYDCTSIKKPYDTPLSTEALADGYTKTSQGTVIPRCMCQQGGYGDGASGQSGIILVSNCDQNNNNQFDNGDELWGVDRDMESMLANDSVTQD